MMRSRSLILFAALVGFTSACESDDDDIVARYSATLTGGAEVPPVTTSATGSFEATLDEDNILTYNVTFSGLGSNSILGHIHGPGAAGVNAGVLVNFDQPTIGRVLTLGATAGTATGTVNLTTAINGTVTGDSLLVLLNNGNAYVNIHSQNRPGGEIRGQIARQ
jgi:hypothetical protein